MKKLLEFLFAMLLFFGSILSFGQRELPPKEKPAHGM